MIYLQICTFTFSLFSFFSDGPYLRKALGFDRELKGDLTSFHSAIKAFTSNILSALNARFVENPGILRACSVIDLKIFPKITDEIKG